MNSSISVSFLREKQKKNSWLWYAIILMIMICLHKVQDTYFLLFKFLIW